MESQPEKALVPTTSRVLPDGRLVELVREGGNGRTQLAIASGPLVSVVGEVTVGSETLIPVAGTNSLLRNQAIMLPERPEIYGSPQHLLQDIYVYLDKYVVLSPWFRTFAAYYVLFTWVYDAFEEVPYARVQAEFGAGKTRALIVIGSLCYRAFFASGASTVSPIFHTLDTFRGTLILDEADFRFSDKTSELTKVLNNGHARGFPVFRTAITQKREFDPRAFHVFGPKLVAMRKSFDDAALESRFITERLDGLRLKSDTPINLPKEQRAEAQELRNKLLQYRFDYRPGMRANESLADPALSARTNQILIPLLSIIDDESARDTIKGALLEHEGELAQARQATPEARLLGILIAHGIGKAGAPLQVGELTNRFIKLYGDESDRPVSPRYVGSLLRTRLGLTPFKSQGSYVVSASSDRLAKLVARFGVATDAGRTF